MTAGDSLDFVVFNDVAPTVADETQLNVLAVPTHAPAAVPGPAAARRADCEPRPGAGRSHSEVRARDRRRGER